MKKKIFSILFVLVLVLTLSLVTAVPAAAAVTIKADGAPAGNEDRIVVPVAAGTTLGDIASISWEEYLVAGYPPHVDIILDLDNDNVQDDALVFEYAYNTMNHYAAGPTTYGAVTGTWCNTFNDDGDGPSAVTDTSYGWLTSAASGPPGAGGHIAGTLATWKAGNVPGDRGIDANTSVLRLEIEVDNWVVDSEAQVRNILVVKVGSSVGLNINVPDVVAISVSPSSIDFGTVNPGNTVTGANIIVTNIGTHEVDVNAEIPPGNVLANLKLYAGSWSGRNWPNIITDLAMGATAPPIGTRLPVPSGYTPGGPETATLVFIARASP